MRFFRRFFELTALGIILLTAGPTGCDKTSVPRTATEEKVDEKINHQVMAAFTNSPAFKFPDVQVAVFKGKVQLSGFVLSEDQKKFAGRVAKDVPGVLEVENEIALKN